MNNYESELQRRQDDYQKTIDLDEMSKNSLLDKNDFRKHSPTNLSFSLAGKAVVGGRY